MQKHLKLALLFIWSGFLGAGALGADDTVLSICNHNTDRAIFSSHMKQMGGGAGWQAVGWFKVVAGQCSNLNLGSYTGKVFLYAQDDAGETSWGEGAVQFCVNKTSAFSINNADVVACTDTTLKLVRSEEMTVAAGKNLWDVRPNFSQVNFCNRNPDFSVFAAWARPANGSLMSRGWYEIGAGKCRAVTVGKYTGPVMYYAKGRQFAWEGDAPDFCVNQTLGFDFTSADQPSSCAATGLEMINPRETLVAVGSTTVEFEPQTMDTLLNVCNNTGKTLFTSRATSSGNDQWQSTGWNQLEPKECVQVNLGSYSGKVHLYGERDLGEVFWGSGPFNFCVHRRDAFTLADASNPMQCSSDINLKMVPSFEFVIAPGTNTFNFQE